MTVTVEPASIGPPKLIGGALVCAGGAGLLLARPWLVQGVEHAVPVLVAVFVIIAAVGAWWPLHRIGPLARPRTALLVMAVGLAAFGLGRLVAGGRSAAPALAGYVVLNTLAAVAEEALFRRLLYGVLEPFGPPVAVIASAAAFAVVHLTVWGAWVLPIDLAAGLLLSWQRWASGRWSVPAVTHAFANLVAVLG